MIGGSNVAYASVNHLFSSCFSTIDRGKDVFSAIDKHGTMSICCNKATLEASSCEGQWTELHLFHKHSTDVKWHSLSEPCLSLQCDILLRNTRIRILSPCKSYINLRHSVALGYLSLRTPLQVLTGSTASIQQRTLQSLQIP